VEKTEDGFAFIDLYLDVWQVAGGKPTILDQDELTEAVNTGYVSPEEADEVRVEAKKVIELLTSHPEILKF
jgi:predicted RNA-binding protein associated with RNAse of E/G family